VEKRCIVIGTRPSALAAAQGGLVKAALEKAEPAYRFELRRISTRGDKHLRTPLVRIGGTGVFVKELEEALRRREVDLAVHSLKDVPTSLPAGLTLLAVPERADAHDVLIARKPWRLDTLPHGAVIGTGSLRRRAQLLAQREDLDVRDIRGNIETRLRRLGESAYDAIVVARAGLDRLGLRPPCCHELSFEVMLSAVGQGALVLEGRSDDEEVARIASSIDDPLSAKAALAERAFLEALGGGCQVPVGALATVVGDRVILEGAIIATDGSLVVRMSAEGTAADAEVIGRRLAHDLLSSGGQEILDAARTQGEAR